MSLEVSSFLHLKRSALALIVVLSSHPFNNQAILYNRKLFCGMLFPQLFFNSLFNSS